MVRSSFGIPVCVSIIAEVVFFPEEIPELGILALLSVIKVQRLVGDLTLSDLPKAVWRVIIADPPRTNRS